MARWVPAFDVAPRAGPRFLQLAQGLIDDVRRGRLVPGQRLPGSRELARMFGCHRNTVLAALSELEAQGWITTAPARGTFVSTSLPDVRVEARHLTRRFGATLPPLPFEVRAFDPQVAGVRTLSGGMPDPRLFPVDALARAWRRVVKRHGSKLLEYGHPAGHAGLRRALAEMVSTVRAVPATSDQVLVTRGSQMALDLCARALLRPGDVVAVEALGYRPAWDALRLTGATLVPVKLDAEGLDVTALEAVGPSLRAVYLTPHHQYPTTVTLSASRRMELLALAKRRRFVVLEDDYDHEFQYEGRPVFPLASADDDGLVVYLGTLSKVLAPGLRLGFVVAPRTLIERLVQLRAVMDRQGDHPMEAAVAELLDEGEVQRHIRKMRRAYQLRRDVLAEALEGFGELSFERPRGGISVWVRSARGATHFDQFRRRCAARGVWLAAGAQYAFDEHPLPATRIVFSRWGPGELKRAVEVMRASWR
jgi:GntR family transcriptional regulator / MocR family aminotransferase